MNTVEDHRRTTAAKSWLFRLIACSLPCIVGAVAITYILFEQERLIYDKSVGRVRFQTPPVYLQEPGHEQTGHRYVYDATLGWRNIPNWRASTRGHALTINSNGLRDREYSFEKPAGTTRLLVLGDSYVWGYGVSDEDVFTEVLERKLAGTSNPWEVINTGVSGWGTDQEYLFLKSEGIRYAPDIVVLGFFLLNDLRNNIASRQYGISKPVFLDTALNLGSVPVPLPQSNSTVVRSQVDAVELTVAIIKAMNQVCHESNSRLIVMKFGLFLDRDNAAYLKDEYEFERLLQQHVPDVPYCDVDAAFAKLSISKEQLIEGNDDGHWNAFGHQVVADVLEKFINELPARSSQQ